GRILHYAERTRIRTLRELASIAPFNLLAEPNLGTRTIAQTRAVIERVLGTAWENLAASTPVTARTASHPRDDLRATLPPRCDAPPLDDLRLPVRMRNFAGREELRTLGGLCARSSGDLLRAKNLGRRSMAQLVDSVRNHMARASAPERDRARGAHRVVASEAA